MSPEQAAGAAHRIRRDGLIFHPGRETSLLFWNQNGEASGGRTLKEDNPGNEIRDSGKATIDPAKPY
jgi:hypothetical protein